MGYRVSVDLFSRRLLCFLFRERLHFPPSISRVIRSGNPVGFSVVREQEWSFPRRTARASCWFMSPALPQLHGSELPSLPASSRSLLLQPWQRGARDRRHFRVSRFGFGVKYSGFLHLEPCFVLSCT
uniref:Uncharacterized protein n=1 Tax=Setaria viridis TaxID=4556 RepID=A0A4U6VUZ4_SETVI|nr:hypothetical protein SEVIR_2G177501v2 [Setaria viridis]